MQHNILDDYERPARLYPALIVLSPIILDVYLTIPEIRDLTKSLITIVVSLGILMMLSIIARNTGKKKAPILFKKWGGMPTTILLRQSDNKIDPITKRRYYNYLENSITGYKTPTPEYEKENGNSADQIYESATRWLREKTRDKKTYPLVFKENIGYGFCRNLWSLKSVSISASYSF